MVYLAPSILSADFANLERDIKIAEKAGAPFIHVDVMDGHFVPNLTWGAPVTKALRKHIQGVMDVHLMIEHPDAYLKDFKEAGADIVTVHYEACTHIHRTLQIVHELGMKAGVALNPGTPVAMLESIIDEVDMLLIMSVNPGFGGQKFIPYTYTKIAQVKAMAKERNKELLIQVDGGVDLGNVEAVVKAGANVIVAGSALFGASDVTRCISAFLEKFNN